MRPAPSRTRRPSNGRREQGIGRAYWGSDRSIVAAKRRRLTDIVLSGLLPVLCAGLLGASPPAVAEETDGSGEELQSQFNPPPAELKSQFNPTAFLRRQGSKAPAPIDERDLPGPGQIGRASCRERV